MMHHDARFSSIFIEFHRISSNFFEFRRFLSIFFNFRRFSSIFIDFLRFSSIFIDLRVGTGDRAPRHRLMGKHPVRCRAGIYPPAFFFPGPVHPIPPYEGGGPRRGNTTQQRHDGVAQRPRCHHRVQGASVNPFGYPPLSDKARGKVITLYTLL